MNSSESIATLSPALLSAQKAIGGAVKGSKNPFYKSDYADLSTVIEVVKGPLNENGIAFVQAVNTDGGAAYVETVLLHESGEWISAMTPVYCAKPNDPQALGSGITYSKRYGLQAMLGVPSVDDDGESAMARDFQKNVIDKPPAPKANKFREPDGVQEKTGMFELLEIMKANGKSVEPDEVYGAVWMICGKYPKTAEEAAKLYGFNKFQQWLQEVA